MTNRYAMPAPTQEEIQDYFLNNFPTAKIYINGKFHQNEKIGVRKSNEVLKYFVIMGTNRLPAQLHMGIFRDGEKIKGHNLIPATITPKSFCFESLTEAEQYNCPCGRKGCQYSPYLRAAVHTFRQQMSKL